MSMQEYADDSEDVEAAVLRTELAYADVMVGGEELYAAYKKQERGLSQLEKLDLWQRLPDETREEFTQIRAARQRRDALRTYALAILGHATCVVGGLVCIVVEVARGPHHISGLVTTAGFLVAAFGWIPFAEMASRAKAELLRQP